MINGMEKRKKKRKKRRLRAGQLHSVTYLIYRYIPASTFRIDFFFSARWHTISMLGELLEQLELSTKSAKSRKKLGVRKKKGFLTFLAREKCYTKIILKSM